jgi:hypothetical protein
MRVLLALILFASSCATTTPDPPPTPPPSSACAAACENLSRLGCPEGDDIDCLSTCRSAQSARITNLRPDLLATAQTPEEVRAIGTVLCDVTTETKAGTCANACAAVRRFGCPEAADCQTTCTKATTAKLTNLQLSCLANAKSLAKLKACGSVACP